ncbi:MAG: 50S ribosomal protein L23 [bacterium]|nr:50S ribosomal protein L23 [bacterium]
MKSARDIIIRPIVSEKSMREAEIGKYIFEVDKTANKIEIKQAVEEIFKVKVKRVNTMTIPGKMKRVRFQAGKTPDWKKAVVTLVEGQKIELFESA